jgi:hypothetical protein
VWSSSRRRYKLTLSTVRVLSSSRASNRFPGEATGLSRLFVCLAELVPLQNLVISLFLRLTILDSVPL